MEDDEVLARIKKLDPVRKAHARHTKQLLAGAAALAVCAGMVGAAVATNLTQGEVTAAPTPPASTQTGEGGPGEGGTGYSGPGEGEAAGVPTAMPDSKMATSPAWWGPSAYLVAGPNLDNNAGQRPGWVAVPPKNPQSQAQQLSTALGTGKVSKEEYGYTATSKQGNLWIGADTVATWSYSANLAGCTPAVQLGQGGVESTPEAASTQDVPVEEAPQHTSTECPEPIGAADAQAQASEVLNLTQVGPVEVETVQDAYATTVTAWQVLDGARTGVSWTFTFTDQLTWASGQLSTWEKFGTYPTVGAADAVERSHDIKWAAFGPTPLPGAGGLPLPAQAREGAVSATGQGEETEAAPEQGKAQPGKVSVPFTPVQVDTAEESWAQYWTSSGQVQLLPAYTLTGKGGSWTVISVDDGAVTWTR